MSKEWVIRNIPFYDGDTVRDTIGGTLRGRGSRTFKHAMSKWHTRCKGVYFRYQYRKPSLCQSLPKHLSDRFTLYTKGHKGYRKIYADFQRIRKDGKIVIKLAVQ